jgi:hypothetical protein
MVGDDEMKSIAVIDTPKSCIECIGFESYAGIDDCDGYYCLFSRKPLTDDDVCNVFHLPYDCPLININESEERVPYEEKTVLTAYEYQYDENDTPQFIYELEWYDSEAQEWDTAGDEDVWWIDIDKIFEGVK